MIVSIAHVEAERRRIRLLGSSLRHRRKRQKAYLSGVKQCFDWTALPVELQLAIIEYLDYYDLKCFA